MVTVYEGNICKQPVEIARSVPNDVLKRNLEQLAPKKGFNIEVEIGPFSLGGGFFSPSSTGVIIYHKQYKKKYHSFVVEIKSAYGQVFLYTHFGGSSASSSKIAMSKKSYSLLDGELFEYRPGILGKAIAAGAQKDLQEEELYYDQLFTLVCEAIRLSYDMMDAPPPAPKPAPTPKAATTPPPVAKPSYNDNEAYIVPEKIAQLPFCFFDSDEKRLLNFAALQSLHPQIYAALIFNPLYQQNPSITKTNLREISLAIKQYLKEKEDAKELITSLYPGGYPQQLDDTIHALERNRKTYPIKKGTNALMLCIALTALGGKQGFFVTPDYLANQKLEHDVEWTPLEDIQSIENDGVNILVNGNQIRDKSWTNIQIKFDVLVYAVGMALAMKYPVIEKTPEAVPAPKVAPTPKSKPAFTAEKISDQPFAQPGYVMKRALNFTALKAVHPQIYTALMTNPIFNLHPDIKSANFHILDRIYSDYCDTVELSDFAPEVAADSDLTDLFLYICRITNKPLLFENDVTPFLTYRRADLKDTCDTFCVTPDELLIFTHSPHVTDYILLEDIQSIAVQDDAIIVNGIIYPLRRPFAPLQEKYDALIFFIGMILAMKYPAAIPADDKPVVFEPQIISHKRAVPKAEAKPKPTKEAPKAAETTDAALEKITKAKQMMDAGIITEEEFSMIKARILKEM